MTSIMTKDGPAQDPTQDGHYKIGARALPYMVEGLSAALQLRGKGHGQAIENALIIGWRTRCELAIQMDRSLS